MKSISKRSLAGCGWPETATADPAEQLGPCPWLSASSTLTTQALVLRQGQGDSHRGETPPTQAPVGPCPLRSHRPSKPHGWARPGAGTVQTWPWAGFISLQSKRAEVLLNVYFTLTGKLLPPLHPSHLAPSNSPSGGPTSVTFLGNHCWLLRCPPQEVLSGHQDPHYCPLWHGHDTANSTKLSERDADNMCLEKHVAELAIHIHGFHIHQFNWLWIKNIFLKIHWVPFSFSLQGTGMQK